jgi:hypothetical protein
VHRRRGPWTGPGLRQLRLPCVPKRQVGNAFCHFASITVCLPAFFPNSVDLVVVAAQIKGRVDNREEKSREYRDADRPHARLPPKIRRRRLSLAKPRRTIGQTQARRDGKQGGFFFHSISRITLRRGGLEPA